MNVQEAIAHVNSLETVEQLREFLEVETRGAVKKAANKRIEVLEQQNAATENTEAEQNEGTSEEGAEENTGGDEDGDGDGEQEEAEEPAAEPSPAPLKTGKGAQRKGRDAVVSSAPRYVLAKPNAPSTIGFQGHAYNRHAIKDDQDLLKKLYDAGNGQVIKVA